MPPQPNKYQFQYWALGLCGARPTEGIKKGADRGIDGRLYSHDDKSGNSRQIIFSVKGGQNIGVSELRDLIEGNKNVQRPLHVSDVTFRKSPRSRPDTAQNLTLNLTGDSTDSRGSGVLRANGPR
jgi:hypothetical protein